jgi:hypothetical protein
VLGKRRWRDVAGHTADAKPLDRSADPIRQLAEHVQVDLLAGDRSCFEPLAFPTHQGNSSAELPLCLAQPIRATKIGNELAEDVAETSRRL